MKVVLCHQSTGRYYQSPGQWVRRADNALTFEDLRAASQFSQDHHLQQATPVYRLAPYLMPLLQDDNDSVWQTWSFKRQSPIKPRKFVGN